MTLVQLSARPVILSAQSVLLAWVEAAQLVSLTHLKMQESVNVTQTSTRVARLVFRAILFAVAALVPVTPPVRLVLRVNTWFKALIPVSQLALTLL